MAINFPTALDTFENPTEFDSLTDGRVPLWEQESDQNDAIEALEAKVGIDSSADTDSIDYKLNLILGLVGSGTARFYNGDLYFQSPTTPTDWHKVIVVVGPGGIVSLGLDQTPVSL